MFTKDFFDQLIIASEKLVTHVEVETEEKKMEFSVLKVDKAENEVVFYFFIKDLVGTIKKARLFAGLKCLFEKTENINLNTKDGILYRLKFNFNEKR